MKWIGFALIALGALLALDHRNWFVAVAFGVFILGYWYFVEREPDGVPPDESDSLHRGEQPTKLQESSTSFDLPDLAPFLRGLLPQVTGGYTAKAVLHLAELAARMKPDERAVLSMKLHFRGSAFRSTLASSRVTSKRSPFTFTHRSRLQTSSTARWLLSMPNVACSLHESRTDRILR